MFSSILASIICFNKLIDILTDATTEYLDAQIRAGAEVIKIFDSWAGALSGLDIIEYSYKPLLKIVTDLKKKYPDIDPNSINHVYCEIQQVEKNKVQLPYELWSMDKIKPDTNAVTKWNQKYKIKPS